MKKVIFSLVILLTGLAKAQDPHFSQTYMQSMYLNPALTGKDMGWQTNLQYRHQWPKIGLWSTTNFGVQKQLTKYNAGLGFTIMNDVTGEGTINTSYAGFNYARFFNFSDDFNVSLGAKGELIGKSVAWEKLTFGDQIDARYGFVVPTTSEVPASFINYVNFSLGTDLCFRNTNIGLVVFNLLEPNESFFGDYHGLPRRYRIYGSHKFKLNEKTSLIPVVNYKYQGSFYSLVSGLNAQYDFVNVFFGRRTEDAIIYGVGVNFKRLKVQYSYDQTISELSGYTGGSHEFGLIFRFGSKEGYEDGTFVF